MQAEVDPVYPDKQPDFFLPSPKFLHEDTELKSCGRSAAVQFQTNSLKTKQTSKQNCKEI
jgi:hypothetical protein